jgi:UPF0716 family protein affecting phage T7 exclusion
MFTMLKPLLLLVFIADLVLLGVMVHYTSWLFMLGFVFVSMLCGGWMLNAGVRRYVKKNLMAVKTCEMPAESFLLGAVSRLAAGMLLIVPGVLTDLMALLLLSPAGKWLAHTFLSTIFSRMMSQYSGDQFDFTSAGNFKGDSPIFVDTKIGTVPEMPAKDEIIDVRVTNDNKDERENGD